MASLQENKAVRRGNGSVSSILCDLALFTVNSLQDLMAFVAPGVATTEGQTISSMVVSRGCLLSGERLGGMPDGLVRAMAATLDGAAAEMEVCV